MNKYLIILSVLAVLSVFGLVVDRQHQKAEKERYKSNYEATEQGLIRERTQNNELMIKVSALELNTRELRDYYGGIQDELKNMDIKLRKLQSYTSTATETVYNFHTAFKDTIVRDTVKLEKLDYHTEWIDLEILKEDVNARVQIHTTDTLIQAVYWERSRNFWFIKFGRKIYSQKIRLTNPDSDIRYSEFILPKRR